jgi:hypothetical protein
MAELQYSEPDPLTPDEIKRRVLALDRDDRFDFMLLTFDPVEEKAGDRRRFNSGPPAKTGERRRGRRAA